MSVHTKTRRIRSDVKRSAKSRSMGRTKEKSIPWRTALKDRIKKYSEQALMLRGNRHKAGMTQKEVATALHMHPHRISELETGKRAISKQMAQKLGELFHVNYKRFL